MVKRLIGSALVLGVAVPIILIGGLVFKIVACGIAALAIYEMINANKDLKKVPNTVKAISFITIPAIVVLNMNLSYFSGIELISLLIPIVVMMILSLIYNKQGYGINEAYKISFIATFISLICLGFIIVMNVNRDLLIYLIIIAVATDVFAYLGGKLFGKHKFTKISPNKTLEGCVIGTIAGTALSYIYYIKEIPFSNGVLIFGITLLLSVVGQIGDLFFSLIKRENNIKDYSNLIPGHGGICDRLDSLSFIVMVFLILFKYL